MEEQRRVQEAEIGRGTGSEGGPQSVPANTGSTSNIPDIPFSLHPFFL